MSWSCYVNTHTGIVDTNTRKITQLHQRCTPHTVIVICFEKTYVANTDTNTIKITQLQQTYIVDYLLPIDMLHVKTGKKYKLIRQLRFSIH